MQRVRYLCGMGEVSGPGIQAGDVRDVSDDEAGRLVESDLAVLDDTKASKKAAGSKSKASSKASGAKDASSRKAAKATKRGK